MLEFYGAFFNDVVRSHKNRDYNRNNPRSPAWRGSDLKVGCSGYEGNVTPRPTSLVLFAATALELFFFTTQPIRPLINERAYLETEHLLLAVKCEDSEESYGEGCISLLNYFSEDPQRFRCEISHRGKFLGTVTGLMHIVGAVGESHANALLADEDDLVRELQCERPFFFSLFSFSPFLFFFPSLLFFSPSLLLDLNSHLPCSESYSWKPRKQCPQWWQGLARWRQAVSWAGCRRHLNRIQRPARIWLSSQQPSTRRRLVVHVREWKRVQR